MNSLALVWLEFGAALALVGIAGPQLSRSGDVIADKTGLSGGWIGLILVATVTSLPELATGISAVAVASAPEIAVGDVLGSCVFNLAILIILDFQQRGESVYRRVRQGHILSAGFGVIMIAFVGMSILLHGQGAPFAIWHIGGYTPIIFAVYGLGVRAVFSYERDHLKEAAGHAAARYPHIALWQAITTYALAAVVIILVGGFLPFVATRLAALMNWEQSFVGTLLVAGVTSLPEGCRLCRGGTLGGARHGDGKSVG